MNKYEAPCFEKVDLTTQERVAECSDDLLDMYFESPNYAPGGGMILGCKQISYWTANES